MRTLFRQLARLFIPALRPAEPLMLVPGVVLVPCGVRDVASVTNLITDNEQRELGIAYTAESRKRIARGIRRYAQHTPKNRFYLLRDAETRALLGCGGFLNNGKQPAHTALLYNIYLLPQHQGRGLGKSLLNFLMDEARTLGYRHAMLEARNPKAIGLYAQLGFKTESTYAWTAPDGQLLPSQTMIKPLYPVRVAP